MKQLTAQEIKVGDKVPYINTASKICWCVVTKLKEPNDRGKVWFYGNDLKTNAKVFYPVHLSLNYLAAMHEHAQSVDDGRRDMVGAAKGLVAEITQPGYPLHSGMTIVWLDKLRAAIQSYESKK